MAPPPSDPVARNERGLARLVDAAGNRAREGLRVLEDIARFVLDDRGLAEELKGIRHGVTSGVSALPISAGVLVSDRDTPGDVGVEIKTASERARAGLRDVAAAAGKRAGEALRSLEECAKAMGGDGGAFEALRYRLYEVERGVVLRLHARAEQWSLCVLITASLCEQMPWEEVARRAIEGGADCLQLREKELDDRELLARARRLVGIARESGRGVRVIVNDRADIARASGADGVHLGQEDVPIAAAREVVGAGAVIGVSCRTIEQAREAVRGGAGYCGLGAIFASTTKQRPTLAGVELVRAYLDDPQTRSVPHLAISGITPANVCELVEAGVRGVAVSGAVCGAARPDKVCRALVTAIASGRHAPRADATTLPA
ncbi:MAG: thiamine phosphate synthase [Phycisphaerales bacterium]